jgi:hypothetical protein
MSKSGATFLSADPSVKSAGAVKRWRFRLRFKASANIFGPRSFRIDIFVPAEFGWTVGHFNNLVTSVIFPKSCNSAVPKRWKIRT